MSHWQFEDVTRSVQDHISNWESNLEKDFCLLTFYFSNSSFPTARAYLERILTDERLRDDSMWTSVLNDLDEQILELDTDKSVNPNHHLLSCYKTLKAQANQHFTEKTQLYSFMLGHLEEMEFGNCKFWIKLQFSLLLEKIQRHMVKVYGIWCTHKNDTFMQNVSTHDN
jgi:hypothetical protein